MDGADADSPVLQAVVKLAAKHDLFLHAHSNADAVTRMFRQDPDARILWAHAGFEPLDVVERMLAQYEKLWADLSFRTPENRDGGVRSEWRALFERFPDRFILGSDTYTPSRWPYAPIYAGEARIWLQDLPEEIRLNIAYRNAESLLAARWQ